MRELRERNSDYGRRIREGSEGVFGLKLILLGETPSKKNSRITLRNGRTIPSKRYREWHENAVVQVTSQCRAKPLIEKCNISMKFYHGDLRRRDSDNGATSVLDLLTDCGVIKDDNWQIVRNLNISNDYDKNKARVEVFIEEVAEGK